MLVIDRENLLYCVCVTQHLHRNKSHPAQIPGLEKASVVCYTTQSVHTNEGPCASAYNSTNMLFVKLVDALHSMSILATLAGLQSSQLYQDPALCKHENAPCTNAP